MRASYAEVGNAPQRFITGVNTPLQTGGIVSSDSYAPAVNLTPERTKSFEVGLNAKFLGNKIWTDVTYYNTNTYNQLFSYDAPPSTGYKRAYINAGKVNNWGIEAVVGYKNKWARLLVVDQCQLLDEPQRGEGAGSRRHARRGR